MNTPGCLFEGTSAPEIESSDNSYAVEEGEASGQITGGDKREGFACFQHLGFLSYSTFIGNVGNLNNAIETTPRTWEVVTSSGPSSAEEDGIHFVHLSEANDDLVIEMSVSLSNRFSGQYVSVYMETGHRLTIQDLVVIDYAGQNVALHKPTSSSTGTESSSFAVDGDASSTFMSADVDGDETPWLWLDLDQVHEIESIQIAGICNSSHEAGSPCKGHVELLNSNFVVVAREEVTSSPQEINLGGSAMARGGVSFRENGNNDPESNHFSLFVTAGQLFWIQRRDASGETSMSYELSKTPASRIRVEKVQGTFRALYQRGTEWVQIDSLASLEFSRNVTVGIAVSAGGRQNEAGRDYMATLHAKDLEMKAFTLDLASNSTRFVAKDGCSLGILSPTEDMSHCSAGYQIFLKSTEADSSLVVSECELSSYEVFECSPVVVDGYDFIGNGECLDNSGMSYSNTGFEVSTIADCRRICSTYSENADFRGLHWISPNVCQCLFDSSTALESLDSPDGAALQSDIGSGKIDSSAIGSGNSHAACYGFVSRSFLTRSFDYTATRAISINPPCLSFCLENRILPTPERTHFLACALTVTAKHTTACLQS